MEREIVVRGEGEIRVMPDRATVRVVVDGEGSSQEEAYSAAAGVAAAVDDVFTRDMDAFDRVRTTALVVQPRTRWRKGETVRTGWRASRTSIVEIRALERVGELLAVLAGAGGAISGLSWELEPGHEAYDQARQAAGRDARQRAEVYAAALGVTLGRLAWVAEPGLRLAGSAVVGTARFAAARTFAAEAPEEPIEVTPEEIIVEAMVEVGFNIAND